MDRIEPAISYKLQSAYEEDVYSERETEWREIAGKYKADNILTVCKAQKFTKVLECGAGDGSILKYLDKSNVCEELYGIDISDSAIEQIRKRNINKLKDVRKFNGYEIPYDDKQFDMVYCSHVIEHVENPRILLRELKRISKFQVFEIPLDYSVGVDSKVQYFLSYGHINVYTPSLFKFLIKSEGYVIMQELFSHMSDEVLRFSWYKNMKLKKTIGRELRIRVYPIHRLLKKIIFGSSRYRENEYQAYTCLAKGVNDLVINTTGSCKND